MWWFPILQICEVIYLCSLVSILTGAKSRIFVLLTCISLITSDVRVCVLGIWMPSFDKCPFIYFTYFSDICLPTCHNQWQPWVFILCDSPQKSLLLVGQNFSTLSRFHYFLCLLQSEKLTSIFYPLGLNFILSCPVASSPKSVLQHLEMPISLSAMGI